MSTQSTPVEWSFVEVKYALHRFGEMREPASYKRIFKVLLTGVIQEDSRSALDWRHTDRQSKCPRPASYRQKVEVP
ncbi:hypothetical protein DPMN_011380 [Dreissena polymorpha]|uniref:Uncharacterized protein n=1 Tax=Dreissena polymorpha TaxID=45954 RepID=A0A9D4N4Z0_DREPO|nr:hypothetical protein DPMN_011380 [Dreissena polymorpha]